MFFISPSKKQRQFKSKSREKIPDFCFIKNVKNKKLCFSDFRAEKDRKRVQTG